MEDAISGAEIAPRLPTLAVTWLPLCFQWGRGRSTAGQLSSGIHSILCSVSGPSCASELFAGMFSLSLSLFFFFYFFLAIPQFLLLSHISSLSLSSGHSGPVPTLCIQPVPPCSAPARCWRMRATGLPRVNFGFFFFFPSRLCCPPRFQNSPQARWWEGFLVLGNFSPFMTPSLGRVSNPNSFFSLFVFYILSYLLLKRTGCLSGCLVSSSSFQKLFCEICSAFKWPFDEFVGEKVVSPSYSAILATSETILSSLGNFRNLAKIFWPHMCQFIQDFLLMIHWSLCLFCCWYNTVLTVVAFLSVLNSGNLKSPLSFFALKIVFALRFLWIS